jgi:hypothetical protein
MLSGIALFVWLAGTLTIVLCLNLSNGSQNQVLQKNKDTIGLLIRWVTGHCFLARNQSLIYQEMDPKCHLCEKAKKPLCIYLENVHTRISLTSYPLTHGKLGKLIGKIKLLRVLVWNE